MFDEGHSCLQWLAFGGEVGRIPCVFASHLSPAFRQTEGGQRAPLHLLLHCLQLSNKEFPAFGASCSGLSL